ncbi:LLM class flavin-dependent oxidoreductase [Mycobacterium sp. CPCC 205372]|uniref:LLM class flavin-dependent oxidoreductase n=1 Tax=Mycobacterium hippophais TaxID=3016340 RepID=A0ABT4PLB4_9MYCO|nr:LLM class flavin-dependent oxidoreductase [Mycobacterium hippophais]MCZ8377343.1 LLM class flavin-dependent oxidoreductase [Mycobacterium hippophais]
MPAADAVAAVRDIEYAGLRTIWVQDYSGVDPFVRATLYLQATTNLVVALGVANVHARSARTMAAAAATLHEAFPGRFLLGLGVSHTHLIDDPTAATAPPLQTMHNYLEAMASAGRQQSPPYFLGALGPRMSALAAERTHGLHSYLCPVRHTAVTRALVGATTWIASTQLVSMEADALEADSRVREYLAVCTSMPNYGRNLRRCGFTDHDIDTVSADLVNALVVADEPAALHARLDEHRKAGADHVVIQFVPPPRPATVLARLCAGLAPVPTR